LLAVLTDLSFGSPWRFGFEEEDFLLLLERVLGCKSESSSSPSACNNKKKY
jgi:hypothetical protein